MTDKQQDIECYINLYKSVHGVKPRGLELHEWTNSELESGIKVLSQLSKSQFEKERGVS